MSGKLYTGQNEAAEKEIFDTKDREHGYDTYYEKVYLKFFELAGFTGKRGKKLRILEAGCGSGEFGRRLAKKGFAVTGVDLSKVLVKRANEIAKKEKLSYKAIACNMFRYKGKNFDYVLCAGFLHHFEDLTPVAKKMGEFLNKNGEIVLIEPNGSNFMIRVTEIIRKKVWPFNSMAQLGTLNETNHSAEKYRQEFEKNGFKMSLCAGFNARTIFGDYGFLMNILLRVKYLLQDFVTLFMNPSTRGTVIVMKFRK